MSYALCNMEYSYYSVSFCIHNLCKGSDKFCYSQGGEIV